MAVRAGLENHSIEQMKPLIEKAGDAFSFSAGSSKDPWVRRDPEAATKFLATLPRTNRFSGIAHHAASVWTAEDPEAALAWAEEQGSQLYGTVLKEYLKAKKEANTITPHEILDIALTSSSQKVRSSIAVGPLLEIAKTEPVSAFNWAGEHIKSSDLHSIGSSIIRNASGGSEAHSADQLREIVTEMKPSALRAGAAERIARSEIYNAPEETLAWIETLDAQSQEVAMSNLALNFGNSPKAAEWLAEAPASDFATKTLESATEHVLEEQGPDVALTWAATLPKERAEYARSKIEKR